MSSGVKAAGVEEGLSGEPGTAGQPPAPALLAQREGWELCGVVAVCSLPALYLQRRR